MTSPAMGIPQWLRNVGRTCCSHALPYLPISSLSSSSFLLLLLLVLMVPDQIRMKFRKGLSIGIIFDFREIGMRWNVHGKGIFLFSRGTCRNRFGISWNMQESFWDIVKHAGIILGSRGMGIILGFHRAYRNHFGLS